MKVFCKFLLDQRIFSVIYLLAFLFLISFYQMTVGNVEIIYPLLIALFFYFVYLLIQFIYSVFHQQNLERLTKSAVTVSSSICAYQNEYDVLRKLHTQYGNEIAQLHHKETEDKRFISAFIHNLKTPLTVIGLILQRTTAGEIKESEALSEIEKEMLRMTAQLNTLLDLQRLEELQNDYEPMVVSLKEEITSVVNENKSQFIYHHVFPRLDMDRVSGEVLTDSKWNRVLVSQIISNAVKYSSTICSPNESEETKYLFFRLETNGEYTNLIIQDQGIGIPEYDIPRVFDAFFTGENGREGYNSSGIGLYLCKHICDRLGQKIKIENDNGCKVTITYLSKL